MKIAVPSWLTLNYPLRWLIDDLTWTIGTTKLGLHLIGANISACHVQAITENQIRADRTNGIITSTWVANNETQKEWLLQQGVTVITDLQFRNGNSTTSPRSQVTW